MKLKVHNRKARAAVPGLRQETQFTCCATSIAACLQAHGKDQTEADVNKILGASPMSGASWEAILATLQYFGLRGSLVVPATVTMLKQWTDAGTPVIIAWNPEGRPWSHASVVADVTDGPDGRYVHVMDSNIPNPDKTFRILHEDEFCAKWGEKVSDSLIVRRPACAVEREITVEGRQVRASKQAGFMDFFRKKPKVQKEESPKFQWKSTSNVVLNQPLVQRFVDKFKGMIHSSNGGFSFNRYYFKQYGDNWYVSWDREPGAQGELAKMLRSLGGGEVRSMLASDNMRTALFSSFKNDEDDSILALSRAFNEKIRRQSAWFTLDPFEKSGDKMKTVAFFRDIANALQSDDIVSAAALLKKIPRAYVAEVPSDAWELLDVKHPFGNRPSISDAFLHDTFGQIRLASAHRVIARKAGLENGVVDRKTIQFANDALQRKGLDGNGRFEKPTRGYTLALDILADFGIELGEVVSSHLFNRESGSLNVDLAFTNPIDSFSPVQIRNTMLHLQYTRLDDGRYEVLAYLT